MPASLCIHGHFYQPPREDPWLGSILVEASAAPMRNWNERILRESYAPLAWARRQDASGRIIEALNCYEWINFNVGPTLMHWLRRQSPDTLQRMKQGDALSRERLGHGNAMAQIYHHVIMPLATARDKLLEAAWAIDDFRFHFGRAPEGMWLSECAVDTASLEVLASLGIQFVILAPRQAKAVIFDGERIPVDEGSLDIREPYRIMLPSGGSIAAFFYHGELSQSIAFEGLLRDGELFWQRMANQARALERNSSGNPLLCLATDGETYGHHFTFGEMALAHALAQGRAKRDNIRLTNLAAHLAANPPIRQAVLHEPSSWSCAHGVERWRSDCGCMDGGHGDWNQKWRTPLRNALNIMRRATDAHFNGMGGECLTDPEAALAAYGQVLADPDQSDAFAAKWFKGDTAARDKAWKILAMQEQALAAFASCAWFFDDIARIEPENAMTFALRALDLMRDSNGPDVQKEILDELERAVSNQAEAGTGKNIFEKEVLPRRDDPAALCLLSCINEYAGNAFPEDYRPAVCVWPNVTVELAPEGPEDPQAPWGWQKGRAVIKGRGEELGDNYVWRLLPPTPKRRPGAPFCSLADCAIRIRPENEPSGKEIRRKFSELSRPMRDYLLNKGLENRERACRPELCAMAGHAVSMIDPWLEAQHDVPRPEFWVGFIPYILLESMYNDDLSTRQRMQVETLLSLYLSSRSKALARLLVEKAFLETLPDPKRQPESEAEPDAGLDARLAPWVRRVRFNMPDMDWWAVQNRVWDLGLERFPSLAGELGFQPG